MRRTVSGLIIIASQLLIVGLFFVTVFNGNVKVEKYVSTIHNDNLNKIATSVSVLFEDELLIKYNQEDDLSLMELPQVEVKQEIKEEIIENKELDNDKSEEIIKSTPLTSVDAEKYSSNEGMGFKVSEGNKLYNLNDEEFNVVVAVVAGEFDKNLNDALAVVSVILNRCDSDTWVKWAGDSPYKQVTKAGQFEVYFDNYYLDYMPDGKKYNDDKYLIAKQAVIDGLNGIRNNEYLGFRAWWITSYSDKYIIYGGNRYGFN